MFNDFQAELKRLKAEFTARINKARAAGNTDLVRYLIRSCFQKHRETYLAWRAIVDAEGDLESRIVFDEGIKLLDATFRPTSSSKKE